MQYTTAQKLRAIEQEIAQRRKVYPRLENLKKQAPEASAHKIAVMEQIAEDYRWQLALEKPKEATQQQTVTA